MPLNDKIHMRKDTVQVIIFVDNPYQEILLGLKGLKLHRGLGKNPREELKYKGSVQVSHSSMPFAGKNGKDYHPAFSATITANLTVSPNNGAQEQCNSQAGSPLEEFVNTFVSTYEKKGGRIAVWACNHELYHSGIQS